MSFTQAVTQAQGLVGGLVKRASFYLPGSSNSSNVDDFGQASQKDVRIDSLYIHPIKSCRGSQVRSAQLTANGILYDRTWLIIDAATHRFCTARELSKMVLIVPRIDEERRLLCIDVPGGDNGGDTATTVTTTVETPLDPSEADLADMDLVRGITIWVHTVDGYAVSPRADDVLSSFLGKRVRLVRKGPTPRPSGPDDRRSTATLNFQDFYPLLIANAASMHHVQQTLLGNAYPHLGLTAFAPETDRVQDAIDEALVDAQTQAHEQASTSTATTTMPSLRATAGTRGIALPDVKVPQGLNRQYWTPEHLASLPIRRFRPNIVLSSTPRRVHARPNGVGIDGNDGSTIVPALEPWEEDGFTSIEVFDAGAGAGARAIPYGRPAIGRGKLGITCVARCGRCLVPNVDPETGRRDPHFPYIPMQSFRQVEPSLRAVGKPCLGVMGALKEGRGRGRGDSRGRVHGEGQGRGRGGAQGKGEDGEDTDTPLTLRVGDVVRITGSMDPEKRVATQHKKK